MNAPPDASIWAERAFTPERELERVRVRIREGRIVAVESDVEPEPADETWGDAALVPGLVDLQVNGGNGAAFDAREPELRARAVEYHVERGTTSVLATLVSAPLEQLQAALERLAADVRPEGPVLGIHLEGPFLAEAKSGAHARSALCDPTPQRIEALLASAAGALRMVTLAPERPGALEAIERLVREGAVVAAGHSLVQLSQLRAAIGRGLSFVTHVGNASDWPSRPDDPERGYRRSEPGLVGAFMLERRLRGSVIPDAHHLHPGLLRALVELRGPQSVVLVSDATAAAGLAPGHHAVGGLELDVHPEGYATSRGGLAGSTISLLDGVRIAVLEAELSLGTALCMASATPADVIGFGARKGRIAEGFDADLLVLDPGLAVRAVYRAGRLHV